MLHAGRQPRRYATTAAWLAATAAIVAALTLLQARARVAPVIMADNATIFLAADRLYAGLGLTAPAPRVPAVPWEWHQDWTFLTQWPMGYPLILCAARWLLGVETARAAGAVGVLSCGLALVGWFALLRGCLPRRWPALLIALLAAGSTFDPTVLAYPSSDLLLLALTPLVLLISRPVWQIRGEAVGPDAALMPDADRRCRVGWVRLGALGLAAGGLVWIRYAAVFVPVGIGAFLLVDWLCTRRLRGSGAAVYALGALLPLVALVVINRALGAQLPVEQQYPVGGRWSFDLRIAPWETAWHLFTAQSFYAHRPEAAWFFAAVVPLAGLLIPLVSAGSRRAMVEFLAAPAFRLCAATTLACLFMLIGLSTFFPTRFDYAGLNRYYLPIKPFYFLFFLGGFLTLRPAVARVLACIPLVLAGAWLVRQDWGRAYARLAQQPAATTPYGRQALYFEPHSTALYTWLAAQNAPELLVLSNFPDDIALETWIPACPTPRTPAELATWTERVKEARGVSDLRVLFVLDPDNHGRSYFLPPPRELIERFDLAPVAGVPESVAAYVYAPASPTGLAQKPPEAGSPQPQ
jgi:hypothetical protein